MKLGGATGGFMPRRKTKPQPGDVPMTLKQLSQLGHVHEGDWTLKMFQGQWVAIGLDGRVGLGATKEEAIVNAGGKANGTDRKT